ncbi:MAG: PQQ-dependent sugar dehydrogenase [Pseudonocardia sp.]
MLVPSSRHSPWWLPVLVLVAALLAGCAHFPDSGPRNWRDKPDHSGPLAAPPRVPEQGQQDDRSTPPPAQPGGTPPGGCVDPDPQVVATCLDPVGAVAVLPGGQAALVAERATGRILRVQKDKPTELVNTVRVDAAGGGLSGLVLSPSYAEDRLLYAYAATATDHRVLRIAGSDPPTPVLTGIPHPPGDGGGALGVSKDGYLLVATAADASAHSPTSLAGKVLRIDTLGRPAKSNPIAGSPVYASGLRSPSGICTSKQTGTVWVTDRAGDSDLLHRIVPGSLGPPAWVWLDRPGVAGCVAPDNAVLISERGASAMFMLLINKTGGFTGRPQTVLAGVYGRIGPATLGPDGLTWIGTTNKRNGGPIAPSDDRVIRILILAGGEAGAGPD